MAVRAIAAVAALALALLRAAAASADLSSAAPVAVAEVIEGVEGTAEVAVEQTTGQTYLTIQTDRAALARYGIHIDEVLEALEVALGGRPVAQAVDGAYMIDIVVQYPAEVRSNPDAIRRLTVPTSSGALIALNQLADIRMEAGPVQVSREQAQRLVIVQADGTVLFDSVRKSLGYGLDQQAIDAVKRWRFVPGRKDGKPVPVYVSVLVNFSLR